MQRYREVHDLIHAILRMPTNMLGKQFFYFILLAVMKLKAQELSQARRMIGEKEEKRTIIALTFDEHTNNNDDVEYNLSIKYFDKPENFWVVTFSIS